MSILAKIHDEIYKRAKLEGQPGWGGLDRVSKLSQMVDERFFSYKNVPSHGKLLELGCGAGNLSMILSEKGFDVTGVDFSETAIAWAKEKIKQTSQDIHFEIANVIDMPIFENEYFDIIYDGNCFHCILGIDRKKALLEWSRILKSNGLLFVSSLCAPKESSLFPIEFNSFTRVLTESSSPYRFIPTPEFIESELLEAGFKIVHKLIRSSDPFGHINIHALKI